MENYSCADRDHCPPNGKKGYARGILAHPYLTLRLRCHDLSAIVDMTISHQAKIERTT